MMNALWTTTRVYWLIGLACFVFAYADVMKAVERAVRWAGYHVIRRRITWQLGRGQTVDVFRLYRAEEIVVVAAHRQIFQAMLSGFAILERASRVARGGFILTEKRS